MKLLAHLGAKRRLRNELAKQRQGLYKMAYSWCHDPAIADDLVQQTLYQALASGTQLRDFSALNGWLYRILANCMTDHVRKLRCLEVFDENSYSHSGNSLEQQTERDMTVRKVRLAMEKLPLSQRQVITLVDLEAMSYKDVSQVLDIPIGTVMSRLNRGRRQLKNILLADEQGSTAKEKIRRLK